MLLVILVFLLGTGAVLGGYVAMTRMPGRKADQQLAREIGISGVPALLINVGERGILISGAQPFEVVERALEQALKPA